MTSQGIQPGKKKVILAAAVLVIIILSAAIFTLDYDKGMPPNRNFYVGIEVAYGNYSDLKAVVDEVKGYTNLVVVGLPEVSINKTLLDLSCDYIAKAGLNFVVLFTNLTQYTNWQNYTPAEWVIDAKERYGEKFLAVYRWDEPGGDQLDRSKYQEVKNASDYADAAAQYISVLSESVQYYNNTGQNVLTADYGLYWFDYKAGYDMVLAEFGWNNSREQQVALCRGAARANDRTWGAMITWMYSEPPYIEQSESLYDDLIFAYNNGAECTVVFCYPEIWTAEYGILGQEHLDALKRFWNYIAINEPTNANYKQIKTGYVLPSDYGFGFRNPQDTIWGLWNDDKQTQIYNDVNNLIEEYGADFDILCDYSALTADAKNRYETLIYWNGTIINP